MHTRVFSGLQNDCLAPLCLLILALVNGRPLQAHCRSMHGVPQMNGLEPSQLSAFAMFSLLIGINMK